MVSLGCYSERALLSYGVKRTNYRETSEHLTIALRLQSTNLRNTQSLYETTFENAISIEKMTVPTTLYICIFFQNVCKNIVSGKRVNG